ncbi:MAG: hypothetical protein IPL49_07300 [Saprospirales bacterium]|nr:hypothetical protein [Saprospirales bacterium]
MKALITTFFVCATLLSATAQQFFIGSGLRLILKEGTKIVQVESLVRDSPAARTNLRPGEFIHAINGISTTGRRSRSLRPY